MRNKVFGYILTIAVSVPAIGAAFAATVPEDGSRACLAVIIDDFGYNGEGTEEMLKLDIPLTAAIMPFSDKTEENCRKVMEADKEAIIHLPMESSTGKKSWVGSKGIFMDMTDSEINQTVNDAFDAVYTAVGVNNHMGSAIMEDEKKLDVIMRAMSEKDMIFVDSLTTFKGKNLSRKIRGGLFKENCIYRQPRECGCCCKSAEKSGKNSKRNRICHSNRTRRPGGRKNNGGGNKSGAGRYRKNGC